MVVQQNLGWKESLKAKVEGLAKGMEDLKRLLVPMVNKRKRRRNERLPPKELEYDQPPLSPPQKPIGDGNFLKVLATMFVPNIATLKPTPPSLKELQWDGHLLHKEQNQHINVGDANEKEFMEK
jgi:hypothetical protein